MNDAHPGNAERPLGTTNPLQSLAEAFALILILPQIFFFLYFSWGVVKIGVGGFGLMKELALLGLHASRVGAPFIYLLYYLIRHINRKGARGLATFLICCAAGYGGVVAWNRYIFESFSYVWGILPVLICSGGASGYMLLRDKERSIPPYGGDLFLAKD